MCENDSISKNIAYFSNVNYIPIFVKKIMRLLGFIILSLLFFSCHAQGDAGKQVDAAAFLQGISGKGVQVLDVRTATEFQSGHIKNALLANWNNKDEFQDRVQHIEKNRPVYIYCLAGSRSSAAAEWMRQNGFVNVVELKGGINSWRKAGYPLEGTINEKQMTLADYEASILKDRIILTDIGASWCPPCVKMKPVVEELQKDTSLRFALINVDAGVHTNLMQQLGVETIPAFLVYKNGILVWKKEGIVPKEELTAYLK